MTRDSRTVSQFNGTVTPHTFDQDTNVALTTETSLSRAALLGAIEEFGGGGSIVLPTFWNRTYDNRTAMPGTDTTLALFDGTLYGGIIAVHESGKAIQTLGINITIAAAGTAEVALYSINADSDLGSLIAEGASSINTGTTGYKEVNLFQAVDPNYYAVLVRSTAEITIKGFQASGGLLGRSTTTADIYSGLDRNAVDFPATINAGTRSTVAPLVFFELDTP